jgi:hypothetical protein
MSNKIRIGIQIMSLKEELRLSGAPKMILAMTMKLKRFSKPGIILSFFVQILNPIKICTYRMTGSRWLIPK